MKTATRPSNPGGGVQLLTARDLEELLQIDRKTIYRYAQRGLIPYVRIQSNIRFPKDAIFEWIEQQSFRPRRANGNGTRSRTRFAA